ncbi:MAG: Gfo/Idh/MocA family oxidoreductase [Promethearchaeota archaeon]
MDAYAPYLLDHPNEGKIVAVAEPNPARREAFAKKFDVPPECQFRTHEEVFAREKFADFVIVATGDRQHLEPAVAAMERGYDVLLEKPMAVTEDGCRKLDEVASRTGRLLQVCHVLRYAPFFERLKEIVDSGEIGKVVAIQHAENVAYWHYAHSYVRGLYRNSATSSPMILAKSCHDLDLLYWLAGNSEPVEVVSQSIPTTLAERNTPPGAPSYCVDGCPHASTCPYDAVDAYLRVGPPMRDLEMTRRVRWAGFVRWVVRTARKRPWLLKLLTLGRAKKLVPWRGWPVSQVTDDLTDDGILKALGETPWGRCAYGVGKDAAWEGNDQVAAQTVSIKFSNGVLANFTMHGYSYREGREIRIDGTRGTARGEFYNVEQVLRVFDHKTGRERVEKLPLVLDAHGGGDKRLFAGFLAALRGEAEPLTSVRQSLWSHLMAFAAEEAAKTGRAVRF